MCAPQLLKSRCHGQGAFESSSITRGSVLSMYSLIKIEKCCTLIVYIKVLFVCWLVWVVSWYLLLYWLTLRAYPPIERPRWGPQVPDLGGSRVSGCSFICIKGHVLKVWRGGKVRKTSPIAVVQCSTTADIDSWWFQYTGVQLCTVIQLGKISTYDLTWYWYFWKILKCLEEFQPIKTWYFGI